MDPKLRIKLATYIMKIAEDNDDDVIKQMADELVEDQEKQTAKHRKSKTEEEGLKFYEDMLKTLKPERAPTNIGYFTLLDEDEMLPPPETFPVKK